MKKPATSRPLAVREPVQVYLAPEDSALLARLSEESGLSKAEVLRQGIRGMARARRGESPMLRFFSELGPSKLPSGSAVDHDAILADEYMGRKRRRR